MTKNNAITLQFTLSLVLSANICVLCKCAFSIVPVHILHSKNILNTDLLRTKIKMSWEKNKSRAKLDCSFDAHLMREIPDKRAITYTQYKHSRHIHSFIL